jgi:hypothetical protein
VSRRVDVTDTRLARVRGSDTLNKNFLRAAKYISMSLVGTVIPGIYFMYSGWCTDSYTYYQASAFRLLFSSFQVELYRNST